MRLAQSLLITITFFLFASCGVPTESDNPDNLVAAIEELDEAASFRAIASQINFLESLKGTETVLIPSNLAIQNFSAAVNTNAFTTETWQAIIDYHIADENVFLATQVGTARNGLTWNTSGSAENLKINDASVIESRELGDALANGRYYLIDRVLIPPSVNGPFNGTNFEQNASSALETGDNLLALASFYSSLRPNSSGEMRGTNEQEAQAAVNPLLDKISTAFLPLISQWTPELILASTDGGYHPDSTIAANNHGGGYTLTGSKRYLFDENGLEPQQVIEKGLYMALMYNELKKTLQTIEEGDTHRALALFGGTPQFKNSNNGENADRLAANYIARRDQNEGNGLYFMNRNALTALQMAELTSSPIAAELASEQVLMAYEKGIAATIINYLHQTNAYISATNPSDDDLSAALHAYSEAVGFTIGHVGLDTKMGDDRMAEILNLMRYNNGPDSEAYLVATDRFNSVSRNNQIIERIQSIYDFSDDEIESFRFNWITEQGR